MLNKGFEFVLFVISVGLAYFMEYERAFALSEYVRVLIYAIFFIVFFFSVLFVCAPVSYDSNKREKFRKALAKSTVFCFTYAALIYFFTLFGLKILVYALAFFQEPTTLSIIGVGLLQFVVVTGLVYKGKIGDRLFDYVLND
ncbi:hypothetical protein HY643_05355 [Candidatus Woesearchaeota archaeon]|nr:hypothetical protein [Candidatus Woesearchaeota archaeon]